MALQVAEKDSSRKAASEVRRPSDLQAGELTWSGPAVSAHDRSGCLAPPTPRRRRRTPPGARRPRRRVAIEALSRRSVRCISRPDGRATRDALGERGASGAPGPLRPRWLRETRAAKASRWASTRAMASPHGPRRATAGPRCATSAPFSSGPSSRDTAPSNEQQRGAIQCQRGGAHRCIRR